MGHFISHSSQLISTLHCYGIEAIHNRCCVLALEWEIIGALLNLNIDMHFEAHELSPLKFDLVIVTFKLYSLIPISVICTSAFKVIVIKENETFFCSFLAEFVSGFVEI